MRIGFVAYDWDNAWIPMYRQLIEKADDEMVMIDPNSQVITDADAYLHMWAVDNPHMHVEAPQVVCLRRFEFFHDWRLLPWGNINHLVFCNEFFKEAVDKALPPESPETHLIYNAVDLSRWTYQKKGHGHKIGMACHVHPKKNLPMALQILSKLPEGFELHVAGGIQDGATLAYFQALAGLCKGKKVVFYGHVNDLNAWWEDKHYCLSTSLSEGNPNNVLEAMAKGIKPVVHAWPGATDQFPAVFSTVDGAVAEITRGPYESERYHQIIKTRHSVDNIQRVINLIYKESIMASEKTLVKNGLSEQSSCDHDPKAYGMDNTSDKKGQKPLPTPKQNVSEKGKNFTIR
jgi:glycosyltransferase involved in cell wall biosynthesis